MLPTVIVSSAAACRVSGVAASITKSDAVTSPANHRGVLVRDIVSSPIAMSAACGCVCLSLASGRYQSGCPIPRGPDAFLLELVLLDALRRRFRQRVAEFHVPGNHEIGHPLLAPGDERGRVELFSRSQDDADLHLLLAELGRHSDCGRFQHARMRVDDLLDLPRRNVFAPTTDTLLDAVGE